MGVEIGLFWTGGWRWFVYLCDSSGQVCFNVVVISRSSLS
jgi:hypothetical protein